MRPGDRIRVKREPQRARYDRETIDAILDEALICHLGFEIEGQPYVIPTLHARVGDLLYVHGSAASRMLRHAASGVPMCATVTIFDGLVLARSVFNHSVNYRSVVVFGTATLVGDDEKRAALRALTEQFAPGRWDEARQPTDKELKATWILSLPLDEASAKVRTGDLGRVSCRVALRAISVMISPLAPRVSSQGAQRGAPAGASDAR